MIITTIFAFGVGKAATDKPKALKCDSIYNIDLFFLEKKGFRHLYTFTVKALTYTYCSSRTGSFYVFCTNRLK